MVFGEMSVRPRLLYGYLYVFLTGVHIAGSDAPHFKSKGQTFRVVAGETLVLPCAVDNLGTYVLLWRRDSLILTADKLKVTRDARLSLVDGYSLRIVNVTSQDAGEYVCQIADEVARDQIHNVQVLLPPTIQSSVPNGQLTTKRGVTITLTCAASGNPMPSILWTRKDRPSLYKEGFSITLERVERHHAGVYQCSASNGVGAPVSVDLKLDVLHPPEIEIDKPWVYTAEGSSVRLFCLIHGLPLPKVTWYQGSIQLTIKGRFKTGVAPGGHWLNIDNIQTEDFANYTCTAENNLGKASGSVVVQGKPGRCVRLNSPYSHTTHSYNLTFIVDSFAPLEEVRLIYRKILINDSLHQMGQWVQETFPVDTSNATSLSHQLWYDIRELDESSVFQAQLQAYNKYGWGELSDIYQFYTRAPDEDIVEHNMELLASLASSYFLRNPSLQLSVFLFMFILS
ncbi:protein amalgam-like [Macrosteles quadrilineatus]|uniref:protein amalgam-like n=1 Tax=Macrosteles quadrilineatus TaxID=74068 RepID=UPI0023E16A8C|nr:protein amalgam-like [Macrosteles quadrilineatus]